MKFLKWLIAYDDWQKLPKKDKIILPLMYFGLIVAYYILGTALK